MKCSDKEWQHCNKEKMGCNGCAYNDEIEIGDYVRTEQGYIGKVKNNWVIDEKCKLENDEYILRKTIVKHSKNIIDLIEVDDIGIMNCYGLKVKKFITKDDILELKCRNYELLSIITKEQIKQIEFRIKE